LKELSPKTLNWIVAQSSHIDNEEEIICCLELTSYIGNMPGYCCCCCCAWIIWISAAAPKIACAAFGSYWIVISRVVLVLLALLILVLAFGTHPFLCDQQKKFCHEPCQSSAIVPLSDFEIALVSPRPI
jgi:hypothetical protein